MSNEGWSHLKDLPDSDPILHREYLTVLIGLLNNWLSLALVFPG